MSAAKIKAQNIIDENGVGECFFSPPDNEAFFV
jgi:hypothetical protein